jgi:glycosyltransferase involved in cell wall biosynthesis
MKKAIIIPIYLKFNQPDELPYSEGLRLAKRAIKSLKILDDQNFNLILPVCFDQIGGGGESSFSEMDRLLRKELKNLGLQRALVFSSQHLEQLRKHLEQINFRDFYSLIDLKGFSKIRNTGLLLAQALSMDVVIFMDNDEIIEDPNFLMIACEYLNRKWKGKVVCGKGGFYVNPDGTILLPIQPLWWRFFWNKTKWMNQVWEKILSSKDRLVPSPILLGGNLVLHRHLFRSIPFDPYIPRGEDTDYLINASQLGFCLLFDKQLRIKHLHPERTEDYFYEELKWDIKRFLYERKKVNAELNIDLDPYPGHFLRWTLYPKTIITSLFLSLDYLGKKEWKRAKECLSNINLFFQERNGGWLKYLKFRSDWEMAMGKIQKEGMNELLESCWV